VTPFGAVFVLLVPPALSLVALGCAIPVEESAAFVPNDATPQCQTLVMCLNQRICDLSTASQPSTWCSSTPKPRAILASCDQGYTAITFVPTSTRRATYFYAGGTLVAAVDGADGGDGVPCGPGGTPFQPPSCGAGTDLCAAGGDAGGDVSDAGPDAASE
jgi:hypothetical protein